MICLIICKNDRKVWLYVLVFRIKKGNLYISLISFVKNKVFVSVIEIFKLVF